MAERALRTDNYYAWVGMFHFLSLDCPKSQNPANPPSIESKRKAFEKKNIKKELIGKEKKWIENVR